eukprot:245472-Pyramimonas_sp.AAC.1
MKRAALSFPASTAMGPVKSGMRALSFLSEDGMYVRAQLFMRMEKLGAWPDGPLVARHVSAAQALWRVPPHRAHEFYGAL